MTKLDRRTFVLATAASTAAPTALGAKECPTVGMNWITKARNVIAEPGRAGALFGRAWRIEQGPLSRWCPLLPVGASYRIERIGQVGFRQGDHPAQQSPDPSVGRQTARTHLSRCGRSPPSLRDLRC